MRYILIFQICIVIVINLFLYRLPNGHLKISFLNVGQGDSIFIQTPFLQNILIDGGPDESVLSELGAKIPFLINDIDLIILSHPHNDHIFGLIEILKRYNVKKIIFSAPNYRSAVYTEFLKIIQEKHIPIFISDPLKDYKLGENLFFDILYPPNSYAGHGIDNLNNASVVIKLIYNGHKILFTGDAEKEEENLELMTDYDFSADFLKIGHHASRTSSSVDFLNAINPKIGVIQSGKENKFGHPHNETLQNLKNRGIGIKRNDLEGTIDMNF